MARRLLLLINSLEGGGAEKVMATLAANLAPRFPDVEICLALLDDIRPDAHPVPEGVRLVRMDGRQSFWRSILGTRALIRDWRPDTVLAFLTRSNCAAVLGRGMGPGRVPCRCVISERVHTTSHMGRSLKGRVLRAVVRAVYRHADAVIPVSAGVGAELARAYAVPRAKLTDPIPNPVPAEVLRRNAGMTPEIPLPEDFLVSVGRLMPNKAGDVLIRAFAAQPNRKRSLVMLGEGPERERLEALARSLGVQDRVHLPGYVANPQAVVARATAYVSASRSEGFPNALLEAMTLGRAVISTDCPSGPAEILADRAEGLTTSLDSAGSGLLVPVDDVEQLASAMTLIDDPEQRQRYERRAAARAAEYDPDQVYAAYARVLGL